MYGKLIYFRFFFSSEEGEEASSFYGAAKAVLKRQREDKKKVAPAAIVVPPATTIQASLPCNCGTASASFFIPFPAVLGDCKAGFPFWNTGMRHIIAAMLPSGIFRQCGLVLPRSPSLRRPLLERRKRTVIDSPFLPSQTQRPRLRPSGLPREPKRGGRKGTRKQ